SPAVADTARAHDASPAQVLLAFLLARPGVVPIPRSSNAAHALDNAGAADIRLTKEDLARLDAAFPAPKHRVPLDTQ
ncbi:MAG: aldo/keto reductase, partial [Oscillospiraceae bacterium]|nr:aldo/keto reductase [Oscillospiraceae bacterium]